MIRSAELEDIPKIKVLMESVFGNHSRNEEMFTKWISEEYYSVLVSDIENQIVGVTVWGLKTDDNYSNYECFGSEAVGFLKERRLVSISALVVADGYRKNGIGKMLSVAQAEWLKNQKCDVVIGTSWVSGSSDNSQHLFLQAGFSKLSESRNFLRTQMQNGDLCSRCKTSDCNCCSILFSIDSEKLLRFMNYNSESLRDEMEIFVTTFRDYKDETEKFYQACERKTQVEPDDILVVALENEKPIGVVRLCFEHGTFVLRTMQIHPEVQRRGIGSVMLKKFDDVLKEKNIDQIFCMPYEHLEEFYGQIGFTKISASEAPVFLRKRLADFFGRNPNGKAILMKRASS